MYLLSEHVNLVKVVLTLSRPRVSAISEKILYLVHNIDPNY